MTASSATIGALALAAAIGALISFVLRPKIDPREPPAFYSSIPLFGHIIGMLREGPLYFTRISNQSKAPIFTLPVLNGRTYICKSPQVAQQIQRASSTLVFDMLVAVVTPRMIGSDQRTRDILLGENAKAEGREKIVHASHDIVRNPLLPQRIGGVVALQLEHFSAFFNDMPRDGVDTELFRFTTREITAASMHTFYGPQNPFAMNPKLLDDFWDWEAGIISYMVGILPSIFARRAYLGLENCVKGFQEYLEKGRIRDAYELLQNRQKLHDEYGITLHEQARLEMGMAFAFAGNAGITAFWVFHNIFSSPELLAAVRKEIEENAVVAPGTLSFTQLRDACPLMNSVYRETMRLCSPMTSARYVKEDTLIGGQYLLRKDSVVQIAGGVMHHDAETWGPDVEDFNPRRFLYSANGSKTNADGSVSEKEQVHSAAFRSFGGGVSLCPGRHFAQMEIVSLAAVTVYGFDMLAPKGKKEIAWNPKRDDKRFPFTAVKPLSEVHVRLQRRQGLEDVKFLVQP